MTAPKFVKHKVAIVGTRYSEFSIEEEILRPLGVEIVFSTGKDSETIIAEAGDAEIILAGAPPKFNSETLARIGCRGIIRYGVGTESVDLIAAKELGIWVSRVADYGTEAVATHSVALALTAMRQIRESDAIVRNGGWGFNDLRPLHLPSSLTVGVVGAGRIGSHAAKQFLGLGFNVKMYDIVTPSHPVVGVQFIDSFMDLLRTSDIISLHVPGSASGEPLISHAEFEVFKAGSILVNTSRGTLIDREALIQALLGNKLRIAALDVFDKEPISISDYDAIKDRLLFTPHMAWYTEESESDLRFKAAKEAFRLLSGERPLEVVVEPAIEKARKL